MDANQYDDMVSTVGFSEAALDAAPIGTSSTSKTVEIKLAGAS
jgi:hypothetical protein